jgi:uncharacterized protein (DUF58 family)
VEADRHALARRIRLGVRKKLDTLFAGEYHSAFRGRGLSFEGVREYRYGDDVKSIDWNVSARMNTLFIKEFTEERELSVALMIDVSGSLDFGSVRTKRETALEAAALFLLLAEINNDRVSLLLYSDRVEKFIPPRKGRRALAPLVDETARFVPRARATGLGSAAVFMDRVLKKRSVIFVISDFRDPGAEQAMHRMGRRHDVIPVRISDPLEHERRFSGLVELADLETGERLLADAVPERRAGEDLAGLDVIRLSTADAIEKPVLEYFARRNRARRRREGRAR